MNNLKLCEDFVCLFLSLRNIYLQYCLQGTWLINDIFNKWMDTFACVLHLVELLWTFISPWKQFTLLSCFSSWINSYTMVRFSTGDKLNIVKVLSIFTWLRSLWIKHIHTHTHTQAHTQTSFSGWLLWNH